MNERTVSAPSCAQMWAAITATRNARFICFIAFAYNEWVTILGSHADVHTIIKVYNVCFTMYKYMRISYIFLAQTFVIHIIVASAF